MSRWNRARSHSARLWVLVVAVSSVVLAACGDGRVDAPESPAQLPNPASVYCKEQGGRVIIVDEAGGQTGYCEFADGSRCEEWAYQRGECRPGETPAPAVTEGPE